jgi:hypothetical protein
VPAASPLTKPLRTPLGTLVGFRGEALSITLDGDEEIYQVGYSTGHKMSVAPKIHAEPCTHAKETCTSCRMRDFHGTCQGSE